MPQLSNGLNAMEEDFIHIPESASYPTGSLDFLVKLQKEEEKRQKAMRASSSVNGEDLSRLKLDIIIVGAGLGGLAAAIALARRGHKVTVFEQAPALGEVGAGIQIPSNSTRLLIKWGLEPFLEGKIVKPGNIAFRRWEDGKTIGLTKLIPQFEREFDAPYYVVHRAHFHDAMYQLALQLGIAVKINSKVLDYDEDAPSIMLENGESYSADLIIASDGEWVELQYPLRTVRQLTAKGVKSYARTKVLGGVDQAPRKTGFAAYRATVDVEKMKAYPETAEVCAKPNLNLWIGDLRHVMTYMIAGGKSFNMVLSHPDRSDPSTWSSQTPEKILSGMREEFKSWDPTLTKIIDMIDTTMKWPLMSGSPLTRWVSTSGKLLIMGDAAHAMVPYMSQGAAMAVEDGAALAEALHQVGDRSDLPRALRVWEAVRKDRADKMQEASLINGKLWHFADGPLQQARDEAMRPEVEGREFVTSPNQWSDPTTQRWTYGYDAEWEVKKAFAGKKSSSVNGH
ncbi:hypothetical protein LTR96_003488 [Exophiala xenobiotica]|nr:hypothetical protein LTR96_003488 [Exophiala xenobiotica]KAK5342897.1 hypothetical protein LTR98_000524 [Exophiala xenobiotica]KAK5549997.1 hypothetical protein LTR23_000289 [Chaetothyriales sp. CCFEE 6169]